jgi:O-antigen/teichoic acid export membrane protein
VLVSQGVSSVSNFALIVAVARWSAPAEFGWFALAFSTYALTLSVNRAVVVQPFSIRLSSDNERRSLATPTAAGAACLVGLAGGAVACVLAAIVAAGGGDGGALLAMGAVLPAVMLQDFWRCAFFTAATPRRSAANDLLWLVAELASFAALAAASTPTSPALTGAWGFAALVAAIYGCGQAGVRPSLAGSVAYLRSHFDLGGVLLADTVVSIGTSYVVVLVLAPVIGATSIGALRGAQTLFGPLQVVMAGLVAVSPAEASRLWRREPSRLRPVLRLVSAGLAVVALLFGIALSFLPGGVGRAVLGDTWETASTLVAPFTCAFVGLSVALGGLVGLRIVEAKRDILRISAMANVLSAIVAIVAGFLWGLSAAAWAMALGPWIVAWGSWRALPTPAQPVSSAGFVPSAGT